MRSVRYETLLAESARRFPDKTALVVGERRVSYGELDDMADRLARGLCDRGVERGDRVVLFLENSVEAVVALFAVLKAGATFSVVNPTTKTDKLAWLLNDCRAKGVVSHARLWHVAAEAVWRAPSVTFALVAGGAPATGCDELEAVLRAAPAHLPGGAGRDDDLGMIVYTSGSSGFPKGVMVTHRSMIAAATSVTTYLENEPEDVILSVLPLSFDYGLYQVLTSIMVGATLVLEKSFAFPFVVLEQMERERVTAFPLVPTIASILLQMNDPRPDRLRHLRYVTSTGDVLPTAHIERLQRHFPTARLYSMYGLTECHRCTYLPPEELPVRPGSVGKAIPFTEAWVVDERGERVGPGTVGELVTRGPHVMRGYWEKPEETARALRPVPDSSETRLYTGDLFRMDDEGFLYFVGRKDDIIKTRGEKVSPKEVKNVLYALEGVREAAVVGVVDPVVGHAIKAVVVLGDGVRLTERDVRRHCARHLEDFMVPRVVEFRDELPKTDSGKIRTP